MNSLNQHLFLLINASASAPSALIAAARFVASDLIGLVPILLIGLWMWGNSRRRPELVATAVAAALALFANQLIGDFWYEPRPFMIGLGHTFALHSAENSFPSDHTTFLLTVGIGLVATGAARLWGKLVIASSILVAWARIYLGLHFPIDILASTMIAALFSAAAVVIVAPIRRWIIPTCNRIYESTLDKVRLPARLFPRHEQRQ